MDGSTPNLETILKTEIVEFEYHCIICNQGFQNEAELIEHLKIHKSKPIEEEPESDREFLYCGLCNEEFQTEIELEYHLKHHEKIPKDLPKFCFIGNTLPTIWDCVSAVWRVSSSYGSEKQKVIVNALNIALLEHYKVVFPKQYLVSLSALRNKLNNFLLKFAKAYKSKLGHPERVKEFRLANKVLLMEVVKQDFRKNLDKLPANLAVFYKDQCGPRRMSFEDIDSVDLEKIIEQEMEVDPILVERTGMVIEERLRQEENPTTSADPLIIPNTASRTVIKSEFICDSCGQEFEIETDFEQHLQSHLENSNINLDTKLQKNMKPSNRQINVEKASYEVEIIAMKEPCHEMCTKKCHRHISDFKRQKIFEFFWNLSDSQKHAFYDFCVVLKHRNPQQNIQRSDREYSFTVNGIKYIVCGTFFVNTLGIGMDRINDHFIEKFKIPVTPPETNQIQNFKVSQIDPVRKAVIEHIKSFPKFSYYYEDQKIQKLHFKPEVSMLSMYKSFMEKYAKPLTYTSFSKIYKQNFDMALFFTKTIHSRSELKYLKHKVTD